MKTLRELLRQVNPSALHVRSKSVNNFIELQPFRLQCLFDKHCII